jgi:site-specific DNA-methyltransferase (adenine-specific)
MKKKECLNKILFGDCLPILQSIPSNVIDLIVTDPPYGINYKSGKQNYDTRKEQPNIKDRPEYFDGIIGDNTFPIEWIKEAYRILKEHSAVYVFCHRKTYSQAEQEILFAGFDIKNCIILNKSNHGMGDLKGSYAPKYEMLIFAVKGRHILSFPNGREKDIWNVKVKYSGSYRFHPNEKPISWILPAIINSSNENDIVLDPFIGSGSTAIACMQTNRNFIGIEKDEKYWEIANQRIVDDNKETDSTENGNETSN